MKRREFAGLSLLAIGSVFSSIASAATGKKNQLDSSVSGEAKSGEVNKADKGTTGSAASNVSAQPETFAITITTFFPYPMSPKEYKDLLKGCRNKEESDDLLNAMKVEKKLISADARLYDDRVSTCLEFCNEAAFNEYEKRFAQIPGNSSEKKKALGFHSKREHVKTVFA